MQGPPSGHETHALPRVPHWADEGGTHTLVLAQQPLGQLRAPQVDCPMQRPARHSSWPTQPWQGTPP